MKWLKRIPSRVDRVIVVVVASTGLLLPWVVALGVKLHLQAQGRPTVPWSDIAAYAISFGPVGSVIAAAPLIGLAILYRRWTLGMLLPWPPLNRRLVVLCTFAGGVVGMVRVFTAIFWDFDALVLWFIPVAVVMYLPWMAGGFVVGALLAAFAGFVVTKRRGSPSPHGDAGGLDRRPPGASEAKSQDRSEGRPRSGSLKG